ncbi:hypothetical protein FQN54_002467 [Arachnomyces sp. PD_36]|nr:hypothetical protein FQN54_002467 [Arachnomyces sp. PD_36]
MSSSPPASRVNGEEAVFNLSNDHLEWRSTGGGEVGRIRRDGIIAVIPKQHGSGDEAILLTVEEASQTKEDGETTTTPCLKTLNIAGLPDELKSSSWVESLPSYLRGPGSTVPRNVAPSNIHILISTKSGSQGAKRFYTDVLEPLLAEVSVTGVQVHETQSTETIMDFTSSVILPKAREGVSQTVILLAGDGGMVDIIKSLYADPKDSDITPPVVSIIPLGTGNALANSTGLMKDSTWGLSALIRGTPEPVPVFKVRVGDGNGEVSDVYGAVVASWGLHASLVGDSDTEEYRRFGVDRFKMAAKELLHPSDGSESHRYRGKVTLIKKDTGSAKEYEEVIDRTEHMYVLTTLVSELEKGFRISPSSEPLDGRLRVVHFGHVSPEEAMRLMGLAYQGKHVDEPAVGYEDVEGIRIEFDEEEGRWRRVCVDGKIVVVGQRGLVEVRTAHKKLVKLVTTAKRA